MRHDENIIKSVGLEECSLPYNVVFSIYDVMRRHYFCWARYPFILLFIFCSLVVCMVIVMSYMCAIVYVTIYFKASFLMRVKTTGKLKTHCDWHLTEKALDSKVLNNVLYVTLVFCFVWVHRRKGVSQRWIVGSLQRKSSLWWTECSWLCKTLFLLLHTPHFWQTNFCTPKSLRWSGLKDPLA